MNYQIEVLNKNNLTSYKSLIDGCFGSSNSIEQYQKYALNDEYVIWVMKEDDIIIGSVTQYAIELFTFDFQPCLMLFNIAVSENYRNKGIGKQLLTYVIDKAKKDGYQSISLTCLDNAYPAHKTYESMGFHRSNSFKYTMDI